MSVIRRSKGFLIRIYLGRAAGKRIEYNETFKGTRSEAKKREAVLKAEKYSNKLTVTSRTKLADYCEHYLREKRHRHRENTRHEIERTLERYVLRYLGDVPIRKLTTKLLQTHFNFLLDPKDCARLRKGRGAPRRGRGLSVRTVLNVKRALRGVLSLAVDEKLIAENPATRVDLPPLDEPRVNVFSYVEILNFISVKDLFWYGNAFVFALHTGLRPEELMALIWSDIDFVTGEMRVERACMWVNNLFKGFGKLKSKRSKRIIRLGPEQLGLLREWRERQFLHERRRRDAGVPYVEPAVSDWISRERKGESRLYDDAGLVFPARDGSVPNRQSPSRCFKTMLARSGVSGDRLTLKWYDLRHTHATYLITMGEPINDIAERLGHSVAELLKTYIHVIPNKKSNASVLFSSYVPVRICAGLDAQAAERLRGLAVSAGGQTKRMLLGGLGEEGPGDAADSPGGLANGAQSGAQVGELDYVESFNAS